MAGMRNNGKFGLAISSSSGKCLFLFLSDLITDNYILLKTILTYSDHGCVCVGCPQVCLSGKTQGGEHVVELRTQEEGGDWCRGHRLRILVEALSKGECPFENKGIFARLSPACSDIPVFRPEPMTGQQIASPDVPGNLEQFCSRHREVTRSPSCPSGYQYPDKNGSIHQLGDVSCSFVDNNGNTGGLSVS